MPFFLSTWRSFGCYRSCWSPGFYFIFSSIITFTFQLNPFRTVVSFWGQLGKKNSEFKWIVPKTGLEF